MKSAREWGDFGFSDEEMLERLRALARGQAGPGGPRLLRRLHRGAGQAALGREDADLRAEDEADPARDPRGALRPRDSRRPRRRALGPRSHRRASSPPATSPSAGRRGSPRRARTRRSSTTTWRSATRTWSSTPSRSCAGSASSSSCPGTTRCSTYHERSADRLKEMARALPAEGRAKELSVERRMATHEMTTKPPERRPRRALAHADEPPSSATSSRPSPATCSTSSATRPARTRSRRRRCRSKPLPSDARRHRHASGLPPGRPSSRGRSARRSTSSGTRPSSSPSRARARGHSRSASPTPSGTSRASPHSAEADIPLAEYEALGRRQLASRSSSPTRTTSSTRSRRCARGGVRTIGRFVWESFAPEDAEPAQGGLRRRSTRFTSGEQERYRGFGIESPLLTWGCHPELIAVARAGEADRRPTTTSSGSTSPAASWASASRSRRSSRRSRAPAATTCGC